MERIFQAAMIVSMVPNEKHYQHPIYGNKYS
jgi:hypothetical protein